MPEHARVRSVLEHNLEANAALTVALALVAGMIAQALARHLRLPGIVLLLATGVLLGPDAAGVIDPASLGPALQVLVGFAVSVVLFEGGLNLNLKRLAREAGVIRRLLTVGALITGAGSALAAWLLMDWDWRLAVSFGALVIVTGPTVINPLLRRIKVRHTVATVLEAEGVLLDAIGAILAVVTLQVVIGSSITQGLVSVSARLGFGLVCGLAGGFLLALLLRFKRVVPEGLENVFTLSLVLALFQVSNAIMPESGMMTVTAAGMVAGNMHTTVRRELLEFKEQLTVMLIGMLFILLAADVRLAEVQSLGLPAALTVACLMLVIRPLNIFISTMGSSLSLREKVFLSWLAPRGVIAAAVASLFATSFESAGIPGGKELRALVFMVIAGTVVIQGLSGGLVAQLLGLRRPTSRGYAILGANELGHTIGRLLRRAGETVIFLDSNPAACQAVEEDDFKIIFGNVFKERTLQRAQLDERTACLAVTPNEEVNLLFARSAVEEFKVPGVYVAVRRDRSLVNPAIVKQAGAEVLFGAPRDLDMWSVRLRRGLAELESWRLERIVERKDAEGKEEGTFEMPEGLLMPLVMQRGNDVGPVNSGAEFKKGDVVHFAVFSEQRVDAHIWFAKRGWQIEEYVHDMPIGEAKSTQKPSPVPAAVGPSDRTRA